MITDTSKFFLAAASAIGSASSNGSKRAQSNNVRANDVTTTPSIVTVGRLRMHTVCRIVPLFAMACVPLCEVDATVISFSGWMS